MFAPAMKGDCEHGLPSQEKTFQAYVGPKHGVSQSVKVGLVCADCLLIGLQPILVHLSKNTDGGFSYNPVSVNLLTELTKAAFAFLTLLLLGTGQPGVPMTRSVTAFLRDAHHNRLLAVPAGLYALNNYLKFAMQLFFNPTTTKMLSNLKILVVALMLKAVMRRRFTIIQWEALLLLVAGVTINQLAGKCSGGLPGAAADSIPLLAIVYTAGTITVPSAGSVYNEYALKKHMTTSVHLQNFFLYWYGMIFNLLAVSALVLLGSQSWSGIVRGHSTVTFALVLNNAAQGILSSFFYKFADTILKKYSSTLATLFTGVLSAVLFGHALTPNFAIGITIVFISMHQFFSEAGRGGSSSADDHRQPRSPEGLSPRASSSGPAALGGPAGAGAAAAVSRRIPVVGFTPSPSMEHLHLQTGFSEPPPPAAAAGSIAAAHLRAGSGGGFPPPSPGTVRLAAPAAPRAAAANGQHAGGYDAAQLPSAAAAPARR